MSTLKKNLSDDMTILLQALNHANGFQFTDQKKHFDTANNALHQVFFL
jgi:hypothetical protein